MSKQAHPNPAEVCKSRGWEVGDEIRPPLDVTNIGRHGHKIKLVEMDWMLTIRIEDGVPYLWQSGENITAWTKVEPPPVVTFGDKMDDLSIHVDGIWCFSSVHFNDAENRFGVDRARELTRIGAEAIKAAIEGTDAGKVGEVAGPYKVTGAGDTDYGICHPTGRNIIEIYGYLSIHDIFGFGVIDEINARHAREIAAELNALNAAKRQSV